MKLSVPLLLVTLAVLPAQAKLRVVATTPEYGAIASAVGGDRVQVDTLAKPTEDPHYVDAKPSHVVTLHRADALIEGGADLEIGWLPPLIEGSRNAKILPGAPGRIRASEGVDLLDVPKVLDRSMGDLHAAGNPHFMMDPANGEIVARHLADAFCGLSAPDCGAFRSNLEAFLSRLKEAEARWDAKLAPYRGTPVVTYHTTWRYFANRFGLVSDLFLEPKPGIPPSPPHLAEVIRDMNDRRIRAILVEPYQSRKTAEAVAEKTGAKVVDVCQFPGGLPGSDDYVALLDADVNAVAAALAAAH